MPREKQTRLRNVKRIKDCPPGSEFVFRMPDGTEVGKAKNIIEFIMLVKRAPMESVEYHVGHNHFDGWLDFMGESPASRRISKIKADGNLRSRIISCI